jgi:hypothetical protein
VVIAHGEDTAETRWMEREGVVVGNKPRVGGEAQALVVMLVLML